MKSSNYKKLFYVLSLSSLLGLTSCGSNTIPEVSETIETQTEIENDYVENHLDENSLEIKTSPDGIKYISDSSVFYSIRERFLNNNQVKEFGDLFESHYNAFKLKSDYQYLDLFENPEIKNHLATYLLAAKREYPEYDSVEFNNINTFYSENTSTKDVNILLPLGYDNDTNYIFTLDSRLGHSEEIRQILSNNTINFSKYMNCHKLGSSNYNVVEEYCLASVEKKDLNKISIGVNLNYELNKNKIVEGNYSCDNCEANIILSDGEDFLEAKLNEEKFSELSSMLTESAKDNKTVKEFLEENEALMLELYGEEYTLFIETTNLSIYIKEY